MSQRNGDRSMFNRKRKAKIAAREKNRAIREALAKPAEKTTKK